MSRARKTRFVTVLLLVVAVAAASLAVGAECLVWVLPGGLPLGTLLVIVGLCAAASVALLLSRPGTVLRGLAVVSVVAALAWFPAGYALAGNAALNFSDGADGAFFLRRFTVGIVLLVIGTMLAGLTGAAFRVWKRRRVRSA